MFHTWQKQWSSRRELIAHRLTLIEEQLEKLNQTLEPTSRPPQLVVFGMPHDSDEVSTWPAP